MLNLGYDLLIVSPNFHTSRHDELCRIVLYNVDIKSDENIMTFTTDVTDIVFWPWVDTVKISMIYN